MTRVINKANLKNDTKKLVDNKTVRSLAKYVRSHGEYRSGLTTTTDGGALVPSEIVNVAEDLANNRFQLKPYLNTVSVKSAKGDYPVMNPTATANTKDELAKYPDLDDGITTVPFKVQTYAGRIQLSNELLDDSSVALSPMLAKNMSTIMVNTENQIIAEKMATLPATKVSNVDDVINAITTGVDPRFMKTVFVGQAAYGKLLTMKDKNDDYLIKADSDTLCGLPIVVMPNFVGNSNDIYVGNLAAALTYFDRGNVSVNYNNNNVFAKSLAMVMRADVAVTYAPALKRLTFNDVSAAK